MRTSKKNEFLHCVTYTVAQNNEGQTTLLGAFFGYIGGGDYSGGYFTIDIENDASQVLSYEDAENSDDADVFEKLMGIAGSFCQDENPSELTKEGLNLIKLGEKIGGDRVFLDDDFDGDSLAEISENWEITLRFES